MKKILVNFKIQYLFVAVLAWVGQFAFADFNLPTGIIGPTQFSSRIEILKTIGYGSTSKMLAEPFPLGGFSGIEIGVSREVIPVENILRLGNTTGQQDPITLTRIMAGKGLYNNVDLFVHFIPYTIESSLSSYGFLGRWTFYQAAYLPFTLAAIIHGSSTNLSNQLVSQATGTGLMGGVTFEYVSFFAGAGRISCLGQFRASDAIGQTVTERIDDYHYYVGAVFKLDPVFAAIQFDQFQQPLISSRIGVRF